MKEKSIIIGINWEQNSTVSIMCDGSILESVSEERFSRIKNDERYPKLAMDYLKKKYGLSKNNIFAVCMISKYWSPVYSLIRHYTNFSIDDYRGDEFGHSFSGFLRIDVDGTYEFKTISDDGSRIIIDEFPLVDNDGLHGRETIEGSMPLKKGFHAIRLDYFERGGQQFLDIEWKGPGFNWRHIPSFLLYQSNEGYNKLGEEDEKRD